MPPKHERFAIIKALLLRCLEYQSPTEMKKVVASGLRDKVEAKKEKFICEEISTVRAFDEWLGPAPVAPGCKVTNCFPH